MWLLEKTPHEIFLAWFGDVVDILTKVESVMLSGNSEAISEFSTQVELILNIKTGTVINWM